MERDQGPQSEPERTRRGLALVGTVVGGFGGGILLSLMLSHPAAAAAQSRLDPSVLGGATSAISQQVVSTVVGVTTPVLNAVAPVTTPVLNAVAPVTTPVLNAVAPVLGPIVVPTPAKLPGVENPFPAVGPPGSGLFNGPGNFSPALPAAPEVPGPSPGSNAPTPSRSVAGDFGAGSAVQATASGWFLIPGTRLGAAPSSPLRPSNPPVQRDPDVMNGSSSDGSSPSHGSSPLEGLPPISVLLPVLLGVGLLFGRRRCPALLFDARSAPPG